MTAQAVTSEGDVSMKRTSTVMLLKWDTPTEDDCSGDQDWRPKEEKSRLSQLAALCSRHRIIGIQSKALLSVLRLTEAVLLLLLLGALLGAELSADVWTDQRALFVFFPVALVALLFCGAIVDFVFLCRLPHPPLLSWLSVLGMAVSGGLTTSMWTLCAARFDYLELVETPDNCAAYSAAAMLSTLLAAMFIGELTHFYLARRELFQCGHCRELQRFSNLWRLMAHFKDKVENCWKSVNDETLRSHNLAIIDGGAQQNIANEDDKNVAMQQNTASEDDKNATMQNQQNTANGQAEKNAATPSSSPGTAIEA